MLRNEALEKVERLENILDTQIYTPGNGNGNGTALNIAQQLVAILKEEDLPSVKPVKMVPVIGRKKMLTGNTATDPESRKAFLEMLARVSYVYVGLEAALEWLTEAYKKEGTINVGYTNPEGHIRVAKEIGYVLFTCVKELLTNAEKHSNATDVMVTLEKKDHDITVSVEDNGDGFDVTDIDSLTRYTRGTGLATMRTEIGHVGGYLAVEAKKGMGTRVTIDVPCRISR